MARHDEWVVAIATGIIGQRKVTLLHATHAFNAMWLLDDWRNENCAIMLERCRASLSFLFDQFASLCWGLNWDDVPYDECPAQIFEAITFEDLWSQYLRLNTMARKAAEKSKEGEVETVYEVVSARV